ncbi:MAG: hypothetical protein AAF711_12225 [Planctomycetota bacterium]
MRNAKDNARENHLWLKPFVLDEWLIASWLTLAAVWTLCLLRITGIDVIGFMTRSQHGPHPLSGYLWIAVPLSLVALPLGISRYIRTSRLLYKGVTVPAWIKKYGLKSANQYGGIGVVKISYEYQGRTYTISTTDFIYGSVDEDERRFVAIVNPYDPSHAVIREVSSQK